jgi:hypothetical protein
MGMDLVRVCLEWGGYVYCLPSGVLIIIGTEYMHAYLHLS